MASTDEIVWGFTTPNKGVQSVLLANGLQPLSVASEDVMWIGMMTNSPYINVCRGVKKVVTRKEKL